MLLLFFSLLQVINHKEFASREAFDRAVSAVLVSVGVEIVCLAGFMRIVSGEAFVVKRLSLCRPLTDRTTQTIF